MYRCRTNFVTFVLRLRVLNSRVDLQLSKPMQLIRIAGGLFVFANDERPTTND